MLQQFSEQPREKLVRLGARELTDAELLALFLRTGKPGMPVMALAQYLLTHFTSLYHLFNADLVQFRAIGGIGIAKYTQIKAIAELGRRYYHSRLEERQPLLSTTMTREFLQSQLSDEEREVFLVIFLDNQYRVLKHSKMFLGTFNQVEVHPREIVRQGIQLNAAAVILAHNHPSGKAEPSMADRQVTERIITSCRLMDIQVLDHLVIGRGDYVSFAERGWL